eukprot:evm.model.scf_89.15 EVM.evm.TU.scf_89.15   scf_89:69303-73111(+)
MTAPLAWRQGSLVDLTVTGLSSTGDAVGRFNGRVVFVPDACPGDRLSVRLLHVKSGQARAEIQRVIEPSPFRVRPRCIVADKCGGCQWQVVEYGRQLEAKRDQVYQALRRIGHLQEPEVATLVSSEPFWYRNKVTYPLRSSGHGDVQAGCYRKGSHRIVNINQCPVQDPRLDPLLANVKADISRLGWPVCKDDGLSLEPCLRHLSMRVGRRTGEILLTLVATGAPTYGEKGPFCQKAAEEQAAKWMAQYDGLVGVCVNVQPQQTNVIFGRTTVCLAGRGYLNEEFAGLLFQVGPTTFFQVNTEVAEKMAAIVLERLGLHGHQTVVDAYCGIGTLTLPLAKSLPEGRVVGIEVQAEAIMDARANAHRNGICNIEFKVGRVEDILPIEFQLQHVDAVLLDPPRKGLHSAVVKALLKVQPKKIVYVSCNPATLARDLQTLCANSYSLAGVQPFDFFPQTSHVESVAFLELVGE